MSLPNHHAYTLIAMLSFAAGCQELSVPAEGEQAVDFAVEVAGKGAALKSLADVTALVVTIEDASGAAVVASEPVELIDFGGTYLSHPLSLAPGSYQLTEFLAVDASGSALYATPRAGSATAYLVKNPLDIAFDVSKDATTTVRPQVLSTAEKTPADFGYAGFGPEVVELIDFLVAAFVHDDADGTLAPAAVDIAVTGDGGVSLFSGTLDAVTSKITVPDGHGQYQVALSKPGYGTFTEVFTGAELAKYFASEPGGSGPLTAILTATSGLIASMTETQRIATSGAVEWEHFAIGGEHYLAVANYSNGSTTNIDSKVYRWDGAAFVEMQDIATSGAHDWEHFVIGTDHYLAVANQHNGSTGNIASKVYRWDGTAFAEVQSIATSWALDWEHFVIGTEHYLAVANQYSGSTYNTASKVYRWNGAAFVEVQSIPTHGAHGWEHFLIGSEHYLAVANTYNGSTYSIDSKVYRWNGAAFIEVQSIATTGAVDWEHFVIGTEHYLAVANAYNGSTYSIDSKVYRWNGAAFVEVQSIPTTGATDWEHFVVGSQHYLAMASRYNGSTYNTTSKVYRWDGAAFVEAQSIATSGGYAWEHFEIGTEHYLAVANYSDDSTRNINSAIFRLAIQ